MNRKLITWNEEKNQLLLLQRGVCFDDVLERIEQGKIVGRMTHPKSVEYPNQQIFIMEFEGYIYYVPFVENEDEIFLKTIIPSRKLQRQYGGNRNEKTDNDT